LSSISSSGTSPARTAATSFAPHGFSSAGMAMSSPPSADGTVSRAARQSETTMPSKPHSSLSRSDCSGPFAAIGRPLTAL
jgi:hypothetical protein